MSDRSGAPALDYERFLDCVHCGLCTSACPTYLETGDENDNPRGRIHLMRAVVDGRLEAGPAVQRHLASCLDCRACETACPSGVEYARILEPFRAEHLPADRGLRPPRWLLDVLSEPARLRRALVPVRVARALHLEGALRALAALPLLPRVLRRMLRQLPELPPRLEPCPELIRPEGEPRARVALFTGCVADVLLQPLHRATIEVLLANGVEVVVPKEQACCGALHHHAGHHEAARAFTRANDRVFEDLEIDAVVVNVAGCGAMLKEAASNGLSQASWLAKVQDVHEFLHGLGAVAPSGSRPVRAVYADACHLAHAQGVRAAPRALLGQIPGLELVPLGESEICCGAAGSYALTQPEMSDRLGARKARHVAASGAELVLTANAGCAFQLRAALREEGREIPVLHPMELLAEAHRRRLREPAAVDAAS